MLKPIRMWYGGDPELFLTYNGKVIGSEKVIPVGGLGIHRKEVVRDGVQVELQPLPAHTTLDFADNILTCMAWLKRRLEDEKDVRVSMAGLVEVSREELDSLTKDSRRLGCQPSRNIYGTKPIMVDADTYQKRSAGGHLHLDLQTTVKVYDYRYRGVPLLDIFVGNLGVLFDRDPGAAERRENYGRAGEYRLPKHGLEYRTLSNFWLHSYSFMTLVFGMANFAYSVLNEVLEGNDIEAELIDVVDIEDIITAINTNDFDLAAKNYEAIVPFLLKYLPTEGYPIRPDQLHKIVPLATDMAAKGLEHYFGESPLDHWTDKRQWQTFNNFLDTQ